MIDLTNKYVKTKTAAETLDLLCMAEKQGFKWPTGELQSSRNCIDKTERKFHFFENGMIALCDESTLPTKFADFADLIDSSEVITRREFSDAVLTIIRDTVDSGKPEKTADIAEVFVSLERELFGIEQEEEKWEI